MSDLKDPLRRAAEHHEPPADWLERIRERARTRHRNRRLTAGIVGLGIPIVLLAVILANLTGSSGSGPAVNPNPAQRCKVKAAPNPTAFWRAEDTTRDVISGVSGVLHGNAGFGPGIVGKAFILDGNGDFIEFPDGAGAPQFGSKDFTISLWVRFTSTKGEQVLIEDWISNRNLLGMNGWTLTKLKTNVIGIGTNAGGVDTERLDLSINTWIHIAVRRANGSLSTFVDGQLEASEPMDRPSRPIDSTAYLKIGHRGSPEDTPGSQDHRGFFLNGSVDEIALYVGHGLSDTAIHRIYQARGACLP